MKKYLFAVFIFCSIFSKGQNPLVKLWDYRYGGDSLEWLTSFERTNDGGYVLGGYSFSGVSGDKSQPKWGREDYWIVKTDSSGIRVWDKNYGGTDHDNLYSVHQTNDGGFIIGGYSDSGSSGDKSQPLWGGTDYWILKTDSFGNIQWDKRFGGFMQEYLLALQQTHDGGYILGGTSNSNTGGDKSQNSWQGDDYWVVKIDSQGIKQWDKTFGGTQSEFLYAIEETADSGFILGGVSHSSISGNKTSANWDPTGNTNDYWIVKIDSLGNLQWEKDFGGTGRDEFYSMHQTSDHGYILGGASYSGISGDKTQPNWDLTQSSTDYWIIKTDSIGNKIWDRTYGGLNSEELYSIRQVSDGGYIISGDSYSQITGDKSENNLGLEQSWIVKTDALGIKQWDKTIITPGHDENCIALQSFDGCYVIANFDNADAGGYKTQDNWDTTNLTSDFWMVKFCDSTQSALPIAGVSVVSPICPGTCTSFINLSMNATTYQWSFPGAIPDTSTALNPTNICYANPGSYDVQLIAFNANGSDTLLLTNYINVFPSPPPQSITQSGDTLFAIAGAPSYQWYFNSNIINGATDYVYVAQASGDYNVVATDANGCEVEAVVFNVIADIPSTVDSGLLTIYPNPVEDKFTMHNAQCMMRTANEISVYNVLGEMVLTVQPHTSGFIPITIGTETSIDVSELTPGLYYIEIVEGEKIFRNKFMKE